MKTQTSSVKKALGWTGFDQKSPHGPVPAIQKCKVVGGRVNQVDVFQHKDVFWTNEQCCTELSLL